MADLDAIERTALLTAALRAAETRREDRLYADPYASAFAGEIGPKLLAEVREVTFPSGGRARTLPSTPDYNAIRTRFFDEFLVAAAREVDQLVVAPAGMDSRAFRLDWPRRIRLFEVDRPAGLAGKGGNPGSGTPRRAPPPPPPPLQEDGRPPGPRDAGDEAGPPSAVPGPGPLLH